MVDPADECSEEEEYSEDVGQCVMIVMLPDSLRVVVDEERSEEGLEVFVSPDKNYLTGEPF